MIDSHVDIVVWPQPFDRSLWKCDEKFAQSVDFKPNGVWWAKGTEWIDWCRAEAFNVHYLRYAYQLTIDRSRLLCITNADELDTFSREYAQTGLHGMRTMFADWPRVAQRYAGVEIAPYLWERRLDLSCQWYYSWDVASGVTWDPSAVIVDVQPMANLIRTERDRAADKA